MLADFDSVRKECQRVTSMIGRTSMVPVLAAGQPAGDPLWSLPLYQEYMPQMKSTVADLANSGPGRFGGAITAALFLSRFVGETPWVHIDMYAWSEGGGLGGMTGRTR